MLTSSLTVRRHSCRSIPRSTNPLPHYPLGSSSSNSFPHNPLSNPHLLNPVVSILYRNMRGGVGPALSSNPQFGSPPFIPFSFLIFHTMYWGHGLLAAPLESIRCALFPPRRGCVPCTPLPLFSSSSKGQSVRSHTSASPGPIGCRLFSDRQLVFGGKTIFQNRGAGDRNSTGMSEPS